MFVVLVVVPVVVVLLVSARHMRAPKRCLLHLHLHHQVHLHLQLLRNSTQLSSVELSFENCSEECHVNFYSCAVHNVKRDLILCVLSAFGPIMAFA